MTTATELKSALVLIVAGRDVAVPRVLAGADCVVERAGTGEQAFEVARETQPEVVLVHETLSDMTGLEACRTLRDNPAIGRRVPILLMLTEKPTPEQRVEALREGVWDFVVLPISGPDLAMRLHVYAQAKRNLDEVSSAEPLDQRMHSASELAQQAQRLGALMARLHSGLACVVFEVDGPAAEYVSGSLIARTTRSSDVVGVLGPGRIGILAPATSHEGAVQMSVRLARELRVHFEKASAGNANVDSVRLVAGFDAVTNVKYSPLDPLHLIQRAAAAARTGSHEPEQFWLRRHREEDLPVAAGTSQRANQPW